MTMDAVRSAILSGQPWARLDELVRAELAVGRTVNQVGEQLQAMQAELEDTPGLSDDGDDALLDTLESLFQMGPRKFWYENPPVLPTAEEVAALPRWARVAFAARCARRVLPLYKLGRPGLRYEGEQPAKTEWAVELAEYAAEKANHQPPADDNYFQAMSGSHDLYDANDYMSHLATNAAAYAAADAGDDARPSRAFYASRYAASAARQVAGIEADVRRDFDRLVKLAAESYWTEDSPVPSSVFGPLWPNGRPVGWPPVEEPPAAPQPVAEPVH